MESEGQATDSWGMTQRRTGTRRRHTGGGGHTGGAQTTCHKEEPRVPCDPADRAPHVSEKCEEKQFGRLADRWPSAE